MGDDRRSGGVRNDGVGEMPCELRFSNNLRAHNGRVTRITSQPSRIESALRSGNMWENVHGGSNLGGSSINLSLLWSYNLGPGVINALCYASHCSLGWLVPYKNSHK